MNSFAVLASEEATNPTTPKAKGTSGKVPSFVPFSPYREQNWKVDELKKELQQRFLPTTGKKEDLLRRLERDDDLRANQPIYANWKVTELKEEAERRGLPTGGLKADLVTRLEESDRNNGLGYTPIASYSNDSTEIPPFEPSEASTEPLLLKPDPSPFTPSGEAGLAKAAPSPSPLGAAKAASPERRNLTFEEEDSPSPSISPSPSPSPSKGSSSKSPSSPSQAKTPEPPQKISPLALSPAKGSPSSKVLTPNRYELLGSEEEARPVSPKVEKSRSKELRVVELIPEPVPKEAPAKPKETPTKPKETPTKPKETPTKPKSDKVVEVTLMKTPEIPASAIISAKSEASKSKPKVISVVPFDGPEKKSSKPSPLKPEAKEVAKSSQHPEVAALEKKQSQERASLNLLHAPFSTVKYFMIFVLEEAKGVVRHFLENFVQLFLLVGSIALILGLIFIDGPHSVFIRKVEKFLFWYGGWILLGVASSAGIGSGLHTFLLYLGPYIAQATIKAYACGSVDISVTEESSIFSIDLVCNSPPPEIPVISLGLLPIIHLVKWESFCWGAGTAIGELPPYFLAKAAAMAGERAEDNEEFAEIEGLERSGVKDLSLADRAKVYCLKMMKNMGFFGIMLLASVPNPLFDLAGIFSGLLKFPFWKFFGATLIGKAVIKVSLQTAFIVLSFSKPSFELLLEYVHYICHLDVVHNLAPGLFDLVNDALEKNKSKYENPNASVEGSKSVFSYFFDAFFYVVLGVCVISIVQSFAQVQLKRAHHRQLAKLERELERKKSKSA